MKRNNKNNQLTLTKQVSKQIRNVINAKTETKITDVLYTNTLGSSSYLYDILQVSQGTGNINNRVGMSIDLTKALVRLQLSVSYALTGQNYNNIRVLIVRDLQQRDNTLPAITDVLSTATPIAPLNYFNIKRFQILHDSIVTLNYYKPARFLDLRMSISGETRYSGISSATINKNGLYLILVEDNTSNPAAFNLWTRISYKDS